MNGGRVYWITGLSNSGKTTIGTVLYYELKKMMKNVAILDGDLLKEVASGTEYASFGVQDRLIRAKRYSKIAKLLSDQGIWVIVCAIAMFDEVREWNRKNMRGYVEIFLNVDNEILKRRDKKNLYHVVDGREIQFPKEPDIVINNNGDIPIQTIVKQIKELKPKNEDDYGRDRKYWNQYYKKLPKSLREPSNFAREIAGTLNDGAHVLELGCGNGRDSLYFLKRGYHVVAIDASDVAIESLNEITKDNENALFIQDDFVKCQSLYQMNYDCVYSRFSLHSITEEQENELLGNVKNAIQFGGVFCIEARTVHDEIYGKGYQVDYNSYIYEGHFRRFINVDEFSNKIRKMGFEIIYMEENCGFSKTEQSDPVLMRCVARVAK